MAKKKPKKSPKRLLKTEHPTLFVFDGSIRYYEDGSMLELHTAVRPDEWELIVEETIKYKIFLECLKEVAFPILNEQWTKEDDWFRLQLEVAISRIRNIDPLLVIKWNTDEIKKQYISKMTNNAKDVVKLIEETRNQQKKFGITNVSDL